MRIFNCITLLLALLPHAHLFGQQVVVKGRVWDGVRPIAFASVFVRNTSCGTVTNEDGYFSLAIPFRADSISASHIGFTTATAHINSNITFKLKPADYSIKEVTIFSLTPEGLVKKAVKAIYKNYPTTPIVLQTFYREKLFINDTLEYFSEAAYNIHKSYRKSLFTDKIYIDRSRAFRFKKDTSLLVEVIGGLVPDYLKNAESNFGQSFFSNQILSFGSIIKFNDRDVYTIKVLPKPEFKGSAVKGELYIDRQTFAFLKIDFSFLYNNANSNRHSVRKQKYSAQYRFVGSLCIPSTFSGEWSRLYREHGRDYQANVHINSFTSGIDSLSKSIRDKVLFTDGHSLEYYPSCYDSTYWNGFSSILPDKQLQSSSLLQFKQPSYSKSIPKNLGYIDQPEIGEAKELYHPNISLFISSRTPNNISTFNETYGSLNSLAIVAALKLKKRYSLAGFLAPIYAMGVGIPFQKVEAERMLLARNGYRVSYNPTIANSTYSSYCKGLTNQQVQQFKNERYADFMHLHTIGGDANYLSIKTIEERIAIANLSNKKVRTDFFNSYYFELFLRRFAYSIYYLPNMDFESSSDTQLWQECKQPILKDRLKSYAKYLFHPEEPYHRQILRKDLDGSERSFLTRAAYCSLLNLISPQMIGIKPFKLASDFKFTLSLSYLLVPFGEMFEQNFWIYASNHTFGLYLREYRNRNSVSCGVGLKLYRYPIAPNLTFDTAIDYWRQPKWHTYTDNQLCNGFGVNQTMQLQAWTDRYNHNGDIKVFLGYDFKTKGYQPQNLNLNKDFSIFIGVNYNLPNF